MANQAYESFGPVKLAHRFKGWKETIELPEIFIELTPDALTITPVDSMGRAQKVLAVKMGRAKSS